MMTLSSRNRMLALGAPLLAVAIGLAAGHKEARATDPDTAAFNERCANRVSIAFLGKSADATQIASSSPQNAVDTYLTSPDFQERFARFVNSQSNEIPGVNPEDDSPYWLAKYVLQNNKPWSDLYVGPYNVDVDPANKNNVLVTNDPNGLGYFRSKPWMIRYAGNEPAGIKISTAYHMLNNTLGLTLVASTNAPGADISATGRQASPCNQCHYDNWYALDKVASILSKRVGTGTNITFGPQFQASASILGNITIHDDKELITTLVNSDAFKFHACRMAFNFLYGRNESSCEGPVFDKCIDAFTQQGTIQAALSTVAKDPSFCQ